MFIFRRVLGKSFWLFSLNGFGSSTVLAISSSLVVGICKTGSGGGRGSLSYIGSSETGS